MKRKYFFQLKISTLILILLTTMLLGMGYAFAAKSPDILQKGDKGDQVTLLQQNLILLQYLVIAKPTGYFGAGTEAAVMRLQKDNGLVVSGMVGSITQSKIAQLIEKKNKKSKFYIMIDPGHGGIDSGTSKKNLVEKTVTLDIAKKLQAVFAAEGYKTGLTRKTDTSLYKLSGIAGSTQKKDLNARSYLINQSNATLFVSIHVNSFPNNSSVNGSIVYYDGSSSKSKTLAQSIQRALNAMVVKGVSRMDNNSQPADFYILKNTTRPGVLVETAFISNKADYNLLSTQSFRNQLARTIFNGALNSGLLD